MEKPAMYQIMIALTIVAFIAGGLVFNSLQGKCGIRIPIVEPADHGGGRTIEITGQACGVIEDYCLEFGGEFEQGTFGSVCYIE